MTQEATKRFSDVVMEDNVVEGIVGEMNPKNAIIIKKLGPKAQ
jgi:hypothetical protein